MGPRRTTNEVWGDKYAVQTGSEDKGPKDTNKNKAHDEKTTHNTTTTMGKTKWETTPLSDKTKGKLRNWDADPINEYRQGLSELTEMMAIIETMGMKTTAPTDEKTTMGTGENNTEVTDDYTTDTITTKTRSEKMRYTNGDEREMAEAMDAVLKMRAEEFTPKERLGIMRLWGYVYHHAPVYTDNDWKRIMTDVWEHAQLGRCNQDYKKSKMYTLNKYSKNKLVTPIDARQARGEAEEHEMNTAGTATGTPRRPTRNETGAAFEPNQENQEEEREPHV